MILLPLVDSLATEIPSGGSETLDRAVAEALEFLKKSWDLSGVQVAGLLHIPVSTVNNWLTKGRVPVGGPPFHPEAESVLHLIAIHRSLFAMFSSDENQRLWLKTPHPVLGIAPIKKIRESAAGLSFLRQYLDYVRGRGA